MYKSGESINYVKPLNFVVYIFLHSNSKLFHRAVCIIKDVALVTEPVAKDCLLRSIYTVDQLPSNINNDDITSHIKKATRMDKVM